jgi:NAD(P) transhydrogenase subunit beta
MVIICRRSLAAGFSGEDNKLFYDKKTMMVFGDAKSTLTSLVQLMKKQESDVKSAA